MTSTMSFTAVQPSLDHFLSLTLDPPLQPDTKHLSAFNIRDSSPFPSLSGPSGSSDFPIMDSTGGRIPYSAYSHPGYAQYSQPLADPFHGTLSSTLPSTLSSTLPSSLPSQVPSWSYPNYDPHARPSSQQMWLPMPPNYPHHHQQQQQQQQQHHHQAHHQTMPSPVQHGSYEITLPLTSPISTATTRSTRSHSLQTSGFPSPEGSPREHNSQRAESPGHADLKMYGFMNPEGTWSCAYPGCTSRAVFTRGCDLRKHHKRHTKSFFCRYPGCTQAQGGGFSSKKDLARHEAKHNPGVVCEWSGCDRIFSRVDNMRDHVKRIHLKSRRTPPKGNQVAL